MRRRLAAILYYKRLKLDLFLYPAADTQIKLSLRRTLVQVNREWAMVN